MLQFRGFNDYSVEVLKDETSLGKFSVVTNLAWLAVWLRIHPLYWKWTSIRVYHRLTNTFIGQYSREGDIPAKPIL